MTPVDQQFLHDKEKGIKGDCMRAALASLLDLPITQVPHFAQISSNGAYGFYTMIEDWLDDLGYRALWGRSMVYMQKPGEDLYHLISGPSPRGNGNDLFHCVVGLNGEPFFDPHPSRAMLAGERAQWRNCFFVRKDDER